jgi:glycosyltransferase involved in cell wall biosynthesis
MTPLLGANAVRPSGGAETQVLLLSRALAQKGVAVCLVVFDDSDADIPLSAHGVDVVVRPAYFVGRTRFGRLREIAAMRAAIRRVDADVVVTRAAGYHVGLVGLWTKLARRQFVYSSASMRDFGYTSFLEKWSDRIGFRIGVALADKIVVQTQEQVDFCERRLRRTPIFIRSVSEPAEQIDRDPEAFLWVGRLDANKRPLEFIELARSLPDARFWMVAIRTPGASSARLWTQVESAADTLSNFDVLPPRPRPKLLDLLARAVAVVSTSELEGMPNIFLEGWARGIPALALNHDPDGIISRYGLGGFAQGRRDRFVELAHHLWDGRTARNECAARCRAYSVLHHSPEAVSAEWVQALRLADEDSRRSVVIETG